MPDPTPPAHGSLDPGQDPTPPAYGSLDPGHWRRRRHLAWSDEIIVATSVDDLKDLAQLIGKQLGPDRDLKTTKTLELCGKELRVLPESIGQLANLQKLNLDRNQLGALPRNIERLVNL